MRRRFFKYTSRNVMAMLGFSFYVLADSFFIARYAGSDGLVALNLVLPLYGIIEGFGAMIGSGFGTSYAIDKASGKDSQNHFFQALCWCLIFSLPIVLLAIFNIKGVMTFLGAEGDFVKMGGDYGRYLMVFSPFFMINFTLNAFCRNDNAPSVAMVATLVGCIMNVILDYVFLFNFDWGFSSAALATVLSPCISVAILYFCHFMKHSHVPFQACKLKFRLLLRSLSLGLSSFMTHLSAGITILVYNHLLLGLAGSAGVAAYSLVANVAYVPAAILGGIADGAQPLLSETYGKADTKNLSYLKRLGLVTCFISAVLMVALLYIFMDPVIWLFNRDNDRLFYEMGKRAMLLYSTGYFVSSLNMMAISIFASTEKPRLEAIGSIGRGLVCIVLCAVVMSALWGIDGIWLSFLTSELLTLIVMLIAFGIGGKHESRLGKC